MEDGAGMLWGKSSAVAVVVAHPGGGGWGKFGGACTLEILRWLGALVEAKPPPPFNNATRLGACSQLLA